MITPAQALAILQIRRSQEPALPVNEFIPLLVSLGCLGAPCSHTTLWRLLSGRMYPKLQDADGRPFDYASLPRARRGPAQAGSELHTLRLRVERLEQAVFGSVS